MTIKLPESVRDKGVFFKQKITFPIAGLDSSLQAVFFFKT